MSEQIAAPQAGTPAPEAINADPSQVAPNLDAASQEQPASEAKPEPKRVKELKFKSHGKDVSEVLPFEIPEEHMDYLVKKFQLSDAAQQAMQENSTNKKRVEQFFDSFQKDLKGSLVNMGVDPKKFAAEIIEEEIKRQQMTPEQKELEQLRSDKKKLEDERKQEKEDADKRELENLQKMEYTKIESQITDAISKTTLPKQPYVVKRVAEYLLMANQANIEVSAAEVMPLVEADIKGALQTLISALGEDAVEDFIGKDIFNKVRKRNVAKAKSAPVTPATAKGQTKEVSQKAESKEPTQKKTFKEFFGT